MCEDIHWRSRNDTSIIHDHYLRNLFDAFFGRCQEIMGYGEVFEVGKFFSDLEDLVPVV
jgi:hypothetical protein